MKEIIKEFEDLIERYATYTDNKMMVNKLTEIKNKFKEHSLEITK